MHPDPEHLRHDYAEAYDIAFDWRDLTYQDILLPIDISDAFEPVAWLGGLDPSRPLDNFGKSSWMVTVLRRPAKKEQSRR